MTGIPGRYSIDNVSNSKAVSSNPSEYGYIYSAEREVPAPEVGWNDRGEGDAAAVNLYSENVMREGDTTDSVDRESIANLGNTKQRWETIFTSNSQPEGAGLVGEVGLKKKAPPKWEVRMPYKEKHTAPQQSEGLSAEQSDPGADSASDVSESSRSSYSRPPPPNESAIEREIRLAHEREEMLKQEKAERMKQWQQQQLDSPPEGQGSSIVSYDDAVIAGAESDSYQPGFEELTEADRGPNLWSQQKGAYSHEGDVTPQQTPNQTESIIEREIRLQQEREAELAGMRQKQGITTPTPSDSSVPHEDSWGLKSPSVDLDEASSDGFGKAASVCSSESDSRDWRDRALTDSGYSHTPSSSGSLMDATPPARNVRVAPLVVDDDDDDKPDYFRKQETPLEREMRVARERENELRRQKGLPEITVKKDDEYYSSFSATPEQSDVSRGSSRSSPAVDKSGFSRPSPTTPRSSGADPMRKFASNRLQQEMMQQKERELALRSEGKIKSTSDEHAQSVKYTEVAGVEDRVDGKVKRNFGKTSTPSGTSQSPAPSSDAVATTQATGASSAQVTPSRKTSSGTGGQLFSYKEFKQTAESKIERELREMREREEELKLLRVSKS